MTEIKFNDHFEARQEKLWRSVVTSDDGSINAGAVRVSQELQWFTKWLDMLRWLSKKGYTGSKLWELYKDTFKQNSHELGIFIKQEISKEKAEKYKHERLTYPSIKHWII